VAIGMQKLAAGSGYEYLTQQVAVMDATDRVHGSLSDYYSAQGESPGHWSGHALNGVGLAPGDEVTSEQLKLLFGAGLHAVTWRRGA
jgi:TrwC relaxase